MAFVHLVVTEMRPIWLLWYASYTSFENIVTSTSVSDAYERYGVRKCLFENKLTVAEIKDCGISAFRSYLASGPIERKTCKTECPEGNVIIEAPEPRSMLFFVTVWFVGRYIYMITGKNNLF